MVYVGIYALIYPHTLLGEGIVYYDGLRRGVLPSGILKMEKYCPGLKVQFQSNIMVGVIWKFPGLISLAYPYWSKEDKSILDLNYLGQKDEKRIRYYASFIHRLF